MLTVSDNHIVLGGGGGGGGDVVGAASSTDNAIARFDGATGKILQNSGVIIDDNGSLNINSTSSSVLSLAYTGGAVKQRFNSYQDGSNVQWRVNMTANDVTKDIDTNPAYSFVIDSRNTGTGFSIRRWAVGSNTSVKLIGANDVSFYVASDTDTVLFAVSRATGNITLKGQIIDNTGSSGTDGQVLKKVGGLVLWANP